MESSSSRTKTIALGVVGLNVDLGIASEPLGLVRVSADAMYAGGLG